MMSILFLPVLFKLDLCCISPFSIRISILLALLTASSPGSPPTSIPSSFCLFSICWLSGFYTWLSFLLLILLALPVWSHPSSIAKRFPNLLSSPYLSLKTHSCSHLPPGYHLITTKLDQTIVQNQTIFFTCASSNIPYFIYQQLESQYSIDLWKQARAFLVTHILQFFHFL